MKQLQRLKAMGVMAMLAGPLVHAQEPVLTADTQINSAASTTKYGSSTTLTINSTNSALLQFNVGDILPNGVTAAQVEHARLIVFTNSVTNGGTVNAYQVTSS